MPDDAPVEWKPAPEEAAAPVAPVADAGLAERLEALEAEVAALRRELEVLRDSLGG